MNLQVLSPWAEIDSSVISGLSPRLDTLEGKRIGIYGDFMTLAGYMGKAVEEELQKSYPDASFSYIDYGDEKLEIKDNEEFRPLFEEWAAKVDCIISFYGSVPSGALFLGYNSAYMEKLGKPVVMIVVPRTYSTALRGCKAKGVPGLRTIQYDVPVDKINSHITLEEVKEAMAPDVVALTDQIVEELTRPLTEEEQNPTLPDQKWAKHIFSGTHREISEALYRHGFTTGAPIELPTREAVDEMLKGTDLPADTVIAKLPPMMGCASVEKIAINAVMAGCKPTCMPVLIAAVKGLVDQRIHLEGWSCSQSTWGPVMAVSGPIVRDIELNVDDHYLTPAYRTNTTLARALGFILMNIAGIRPGVEDLSEMGHEFRLGFCIGDNSEQNPWNPLHTDFGFKEEESAVTLFWPQEHRTTAGHTVQDYLKWLCTITPYGWDPGMMIIFTPKCAEMFAAAGWTKQRVLSYVAEYTRLPASEVDLMWLTGNSHRPKNVELPEVMSHSTRVFWSTDYMLALVGGGRAGTMMTVLAGGGDHGGPSCTKIHLPENWKALTEEYKEGKPEYIAY